MAASKSTTTTIYQEWCASPSVLQPQQRLHLQVISFTNTYYCYMFIIDPCEHSKWYKVFITSGCQMPTQSEDSGADNPKLVRYSGADNAKLLAPQRAKRFQEYLQICCNLHRGKDYKYIKDVFFPIWNMHEKENVCDMMHVLNIC